MKRIISVLLVPAIAMAGLQAQTTFSGKVQSAANQPLPGAIINVEDVNKSVGSDLDGKFKLNIPNGKHIVKISFVGYENTTDTINLTSDVTKTYTLAESVTSFEEIVVSAVRAQNNTPTTFTLIAKKDISKVNLGQDAPYMLALEPSVTTTSDGGTGIGYTGIRIRGTEAGKINVTINGVPMNDPESHGVFWVDVPDIAGSAQSIQIQRGVGTSTNGSGAFGASINLQTDNISQKPFVEYSGASGSFNTQKNSLHVGTGLINNHWFFEGKVNGIKSNGYIDRSWANLKSYFGQTGYYSEKTIVKLVAFGGLEETYQAWYGIDSATLQDKGRKYNLAGAYTGSDGSTKFYNNFIDHYQQDNVQLHFAHKFSSQLSASAALHYTYGRGYYEEYLQNEPMSLYGLQPIHIVKYDSISPNNYKRNDTTISSTNLVRRLWLDNNFYGAIWGVTYTADKLSVTWGGGVNKYNNAQHYGEVIWAQVYTADAPGKEFYRNVGNKLDANTFLKVNYQVLEPLSVFADVQGRFINYTASGVNKEYADTIINISKKYNFFNPKVGAIYTIIPKTQVYSSFAVANREPNRGDFLDAQVGETPKPERLFDTELGIRHNAGIIYLEGVLYNMNYVNQLVMTGMVNGVGTPIRRNIGSSYRRGLELIAAYQPIRYAKIEGNITFSQNKGQTEENGGYNNIAYSPSVISGSKLTVYPVQDFEFGLSNKYVGKQYLDNTQSELRKLDAYKVFDLLASYSHEFKGIGKLSLNGRIVNLFNEMYISNGLVNSWGTYYFPQAGRHYLVGLTLRF